MQGNTLHSYDMLMRGAVVRVVTLTECSSMSNSFRWNDKSSIARYFLLLWGTMVIGDILRCCNSSVPSLFLISLRYTRLAYPCSTLMWTSSCIMEMASWTKNNEYRALVCCCQDLLFGPRATNVNGTSLFSVF